MSTTLSRRLPHAAARLLGLAALLLAAAGVPAGEAVATPAADGQALRWFWQAAPDAKATLLLFPGGGGGFGPVVDGRATSLNFLVRVAPQLTAAGLNVAIFGRREDGAGLGYAERISAQHLADIRAVLADVRRHGQSADLPVWLVGTSRGTVSATAAAIGLADAGWAGLVVTSSVVAAREPGALPSQDLSAVRVPVLVVHHARDACPVCSPAEAQRLPARFTHASEVKLVMIDGGGPPQGHVCEPLHWHGYIGAEADAVRAITDFVLAPHGTPPR